MDNHEFQDANETIKHPSSANHANHAHADDFLDQTMDRPAHRHPMIRSQLLTVSFNQDGGCLAVGSANGFSVHNLYPQYDLSVERVLRGGIGQIEMLFRCNLMAVVGGGTDPHAAPHRVLIWDDHLGKEIGELSFRQIVLKVKLRKDAIAVALRDRVYVYHLADLSLRDKIYTADNPYGLLSLSTHVQDMVLACPSVTTGHVRVELYGLRKTMLIEAHESTLRALVLTADGGKLATASHKGTIVRVWDVATSQNIYEFRRGVERASITCLAFSWDHQWVSCSSDKGTTHIFYLENHMKDKKNKRNNTRRHGGNNNKISTSTNSTSILGSTGASLLSSGTKLLGSFAPSAAKSQPKSICQIRGVPHPLACAFIADAPHLIAVSGWDNDGNGVILICEFAAHQEARRVAYHILVKNDKTGNESEEERRRRRARGWAPKGSEGNENIYISEDINDPRMHYGNLRIGELTEQSHQYQTQTTDDDFCEIIVQPRAEPVIDDKPPDLLSTGSSTNPNPPQQSSDEKNPSRETAKTKHENEGDIFVAAKEMEDEMDGSSSKNKETKKQSKQPHDEIKEEKKDTMVDEAKSADSQKTNSDDTE